MEFDKTSRRQSLKVIVSETIMVITVILMVIVLAFIVSGYWVNSDFEVSRQGMLQISSAPSGADVIIDGNSSWLQRTNTSKVLSSGEHNIVLEKDGYDSWSKTINITEGMLYRIHYPRLFPKERYLEKLLTTEGITFATMSPDRESIVLSNGTTEWIYLSLNEEKIDPKKINIEKYFPGVSLADDAAVGLFEGRILEATWDRSGNHVLYKVGFKDSVEWVLLNPEDIAKSLNLTREYGEEFTKISILDHNSNILLGIQNHNLHKIDIRDRSVSLALVENVIDYDSYHNEIIFSAQLDTALESGEYYLGRFRLGNNKIENLITCSSPPKLVVIKFYEDEYIITLEEARITVYDKSTLNVLASYDLQFAPQFLRSGHEGEFIIAYSGQKIATLDMELMSVKEWQIEGDDFGWLDTDMIYTVHDGELIVYDYDGLNRRFIAKNVSSRFPIGITNNRWLYYFSDNTLVREWLIPR